MVYCTVFLLEISRLFEASGLISDRSCSIHQHLVAGACSVNSAVGAVLSCTLAVPSQQLTVGELVHFTTQFLLGLIKNIFLNVYLLLLCLFITDIMCMELDGPVV